MAKRRRNRNTVPAGSARNARGAKAQQPQSNGVAPASLLAAAALSAFAAAIHLWVAPEHFLEWWPHGAFFAALAAAEGAFAVALLLRPQRWLLGAGIAGNLATLLLYVMSRTVGISALGPHGQVEPFGVLDLVSTTAEAATVALLAATWFRWGLPSPSNAGRHPEWRSQERRLRRVAPSVALAVTLALVATARGAVWAAWPEERPDSHSRAGAGAPSAAVGQSAHQGHGHGLGTASNSPTPSAHPTPVPALTRKVSAPGVDVEFSAGPSEAQGSANTITAGQLSSIKVAMTDAVTGQPVVPEARPAVWIDRRKSSVGQTAAQLTCQDKIRLYTQGTLRFRPEIDLTSYYILVLNDDATISVIDPLGGVTGMTQLYAMASLRKPGEDWALTDDGRRLFVSMPQGDQVAVVETERFKVLKNIDAGTNPVRLALQPGGDRLWVGNDSQDRKSGVTVLDTVALQAIGHIETGRGHHALAFSDDGRYVLVTNTGDRTVSIIDGRSMKKLGDVKLGSIPNAIAFSSVSGAAYVGGSDGSIVAIDPSSLKIVQRIDAGKQIRDFRLSHDGLWGFALDGAAGRVHVLDIAGGRITASVETVKDSDQIVVTHSRAYVRSKSSPDMSMIDLTHLGESAGITVLRIPIGEGSSIGSQSSPAVDSIAPLHEHQDHVLVANLADRFIYAYMEGMQAPMDGFQNYSKVPRAIRILDRGIRDLGPGEYGTNVVLPQAGQYQVAFLLSEPRVVECFEFEVTAGPASDG